MDSPNNPNEAVQGNDPGAFRPPEPKKGVPEYVLADPASQLDGPATRRGSTGISLSQYAILVAAGAFATTFAQQRVLANYPTTFLLKDHLHLKKEDVAIFFFWATFAWNLKPIAGIFTDAFPLFGTRRRSYMILGAFTAGILWIVMGLFPNSYTNLLLASAGMNIATVFASTVMGGLMVEAGQAFGAPGRISSLRQFVQSVAQIAAPALGGYLAGKEFGWSATTSIAAGTVLALAVLTYVVLRERPAQRPAAALAEIQRPNYTPSAGVIGGVTAGIALAVYMLFNPDFNNLGKSVLAFIATFVLIIGIAILPTTNLVIVKAQWQLVRIMQSRTLWMAVVMLFLVYTVPGLNTALTYRQEDVLKFSKGFIGTMGSLEGIAGVIGAGAYALYCRRLNLRFLLVGAVSANAAATLLYLVYNHTSAPFVHTLGGFVTVLSELALMDLAVRSTPPGCEALGFALMMSVRNFGIAVSDVLGTKMMDRFHVEFNQLVLINAATTFVILFFVPLLPGIIMNRKEGEVPSAPEPGSAAATGAQGSGS